MKPKLATILGPKSKTLFTPAAVTSAGQMSWASDLQNSKLKERMVTSHRRSAPTFLWTLHSKTPGYPLANPSYREWFVALAMWIEGHAMIMFLFKPPLDMVHAPTRTPWCCPQPKNTIIATSCLPTALPYSFDLPGVLYASNHAGNVWLWS